MPRKKREEPEIKEIKAPIPSLSPIFSNFAMVSPSTDMLMVDFAFVAPSYTAPYDLEDNHVARILLSWDAAQILSESLNKTLTEHEEEAKSEIK